ncbi:MAG TPA: energy transducer TonB [Bryobacteraceae bacterium]|nr:energy transducer TonB [Bryobacteraceae bacterium]
MARLAWLVILLAAPLIAQDWAPIHIEAVNSYPRLAWIAQITGDVVVDCVLNKDGSVAKATAMSGPGLLREGSEKNATLWKFRRVSGKRNSISLTYRYVITKDAPKERSEVRFVVDLPNTIYISTPPSVPLID